MKQHIPDKRRDKLMCKQRGLRTVARNCKMQVDKYERLLETTSCKTTKLVWERLLEKYKGRLVDFENQLKQTNK